MNNGQEELMLDRGGVFSIPNPVLKILGAILWMRAMDAIHLVIWTIATLPYMYML